MGREKDRRAFGYSGQQQSQCRCEQNEHHDPDAEPAHEARAEHPRRTRPPGALEHQQSDEHENQRHLARVHHDRSEQQEPADDEGLDESLAATTRIHRQRRHSDYDRDGNQSHAHDERDVAVADGPGGEQDERRNGERGEARHQRCIPCERPSKDEHAQGQHHGRENNVEDEKHPAYVRAGDSDGDGGRRVRSERIEGGRSKRTACIGHDDLRHVHRVRVENACDEESMVRGINLGWYETVSVDAADPHEYPAGDGEQ